MTREYPPRPLVGIGAVILRPASPGSPAAVLLVRRGKPPAAGQWSIPGGAQELGETAEAAARRELLEEAGLDVGPLHLVANVDNIVHDPAGRIQYHYTILDFAGLWVAGKPRPGGDVTAAAFVPLDSERIGALWSEARRVIALARGLLGV